MFDKIKNIFSNKEKRIENLISFLIILIITLLIINKILDEKDEKIPNDYKNEIGVELADTKENNSENQLEERLENILNKISGVGKVSVLLTYTQSSTIIPIYNENSSKSKTEEKDTNGISKISETENTEKDVVIDEKSEIITEKVIMPIIQGVIVTAEGASNANIKNNIILAIEAATGVPTHNIQVFEMEEQEI